MSSQTEQVALERDRAMPLPLPLRRGLLLLPPLVLAGFEIFHPQPDETVEALMDVSTWFATFHVIQLFLVGLVGVTVVLLADGFRRVHGWTLRVGMGLFLIFFSAYDAVAGIGTGLAMRSARDLSPVQQQGVFDSVKDWPALGPPFGLSIVGSLGWAAALGALALTARRDGVPRLQWVAIGLAGLFLLGGHPFPFGTLAFGCLFIAVALREFDVGRGRLRSG